MDIDAEYEDVKAIQEDVKEYPEGDYLFTSALFSVQGHFTGAQLDALLAEFALYNPRVVSLSALTSSSINSRVSSTPNLTRQRSVISPLVGRQSSNTISLLPQAQKTSVLQSLSRLDLNKNGLSETLLQRQSSSNVGTLSRAPISRTQVQSKQLSRP